MLVYQRVKKNTSKTLGLMDPFKFAPICTSKAPKLSGGLMARRGGDGGPGGAWQQNGGILPHIAV